jgi:hypothetical protein
MTVFGARSIRLARAMLVGGLLIAGVPIGLVVARPEWAGRAVANKARDRLGVIVTFEAVGVSIWPRPRLAFRGLVVRQVGAPGARPLATARELLIDVSPVAAWRRRVSLVTATGLAITIPSATPGSGPAEKNDGGATSPSVLADRVVVRDATVTLARADAQASPIVFGLNRLDLEALGTARPMGFRARLTSPIPEGEVTIEGRLGPWRADRLAETPIAGRFSLEGARLQSVNGLGGSAAARGAVSGTLGGMRVEGTAESPDFSLEIGGRPVAVTVAFRGEIDGTTGTTRLPHVEGTIASTPFTASGAVTRLSSGDGFAVDADVDVRLGRVEDLVALVVPGAEAPLVGDVSLRTSFALPPGAIPVAARLRLDGEFGLRAERLSADSLQRRFEDLSRRGQRAGGGGPAGPIITNVQGRFSVKDGVATLQQATFSLPGAAVGLSGTYSLTERTLDLQGTLRTEATLSDAVGGVRGMFLRPFDFAFRRDGAGAVVPIRVQGPIEAPRVGVRLPSR